MNPVEYSTPSFVSLPDNFPAVSVNDNTKNAFSNYSAPDSYRVNNPYRNETHSHYHVAQAYGLASPVVRETVQGQIKIRAENSWYIGVVMPMVEIHNNSFSVNTMRFEETYAPVTPAEGIPTITEVKSDETNYTITRRAKAFTMEHEYMSTEKGRRHYLLNLKHLSTITFEVMCYDVIHALINAKNACMDYEVEYGYYNNKTEEEILSREKEFWCALQKQEFGFHKLETRVSQLHMRYGIRNLDTYILPIEPKDWLSVTPAENNDYSKGGQKAVDQIQGVIGNAIDGTSPLGILSGRYKVYMTRTYTTGPNGSQENLMMRDRHIGEFNRMLPLKEEKGGTYNSSKRTIKIYDEDDDRFKDITLKAALDASDMLFTESGISNQYKRTHPENFEEDMKENFLFKPTNKYAANSIAPITYFGQMREKHLSTDTVISFGDSCVAALAKDMGKLPHDINGIITEATNTIEMHNINTSMDDFMGFVEGIQQGKPNTKVTPARGNMDVTKDLQLNDTEREDMLKSCFIVGHEALTEVVRTRNKSEELVRSTEELHKVLSSIVRKFSRICQGNSLLPAEHASLTETHATLLKFFFPKLADGYTVWIKGNYSGKGEELGKTRNANYLVTSQLLHLYKYSNPKNSEKVLSLTKQLIRSMNEQKAFDRDPTTKKIYGDILDEMTKNLVDEQVNLFKAQSEAFTNKTEAITERAKDHPKDITPDLNVFTDYKGETCLYITTSAAVFQDLLEGLFTLLTENPQNPAVGRLLKNWLDILVKSKFNIEKLLGLVNEQLQDDDLLSKYFDLAGNSETLALEREANRGWWAVSNPLPKKAYISGKITRQGRDTKFGVDRKEFDTAYIRTPFRIPKGKLGEFISYIISHEDTTVFTNFPELKITISNNENPNYPLTFSALQTLYKNSEDYSPALLKDAINSTRTITRKNPGNRTLNVQGDEGEQDSVDVEELKGNVWRDVTTDQEITEILSDRQQQQKKKQPSVHRSFTPPPSGSISYTTTDILDEIGMSDDDDFRRHIERINLLATTSLNKLFGHVLLFTPITKTVLSSFIDNDLIFPIGFLIFRPHQRYQMAMAIKLKSGIDMGATYHNPDLRDYQEEDTAMTKRRIAHWSWHSKAQVTDPQLVFHIYDIFCNATLGGAGTQWYTSDQRDSYDSEDFQFAGKDIFAIAVPYEMYKEKPMDYIDASGSFNYYNFGNGRRTGKREPLHYNTAAFYNSFWGWRQAYERSSQQIECDYHPGATGEFRTHIMPKNTGMWSGSTQIWDDTTSKFVLHAGKGHFGIYAFPGMKDARNGQFKIWTVPDAITRLMV